MINNPAESALYHKVKMLSKKIEKTKKEAELKLKPLYRQRTELGALLAVALRKKYEKEGFVKGARFCHVPSGIEYTVFATCFDFDNTQEFVIYPDGQHDVPRFIDPILIKDCIVLF